MESCLRCELGRRFWWTLAPETGPLLLCRVWRDPGAAWHRPPADQKHRRVPEFLRQHPELPQSPDPGAPGHAPHPLPPSRGAPRPLPGPGPYQASIGPPAAISRLPLQELDLPGAPGGRNGPVGRGDPLPACEEGDRKVRGAVCSKPRVCSLVRLWIFLLPNLQTDSLLAAV